MSQRVGEYKSENCAEKWWNIRTKVELGNNGIMEYKNENWGKIVEYKNENWSGK